MSKASRGTAQKGAQIIKAIETRTTPGVAKDEGGYRIMRCTHDPGTEFGGKFKELLDSGDYPSAAVVKGHPGTAAVLVPDA